MFYFAKIKGDFLWSFLLQVWSPMEHKRIKKKTIAEGRVQKRTFLIINFVLFYANASVFNPLFSLYFILKRRGLYQVKKQR